VKQTTRPRRTRRRGRSEPSSNRRSRSEGDGGRCLPRHLLRGDDSCQHGGNSGGEAAQFLSQDLNLTTCWRISVCLPAWERMDGEVCCLGKRPGTEWVGNKSAPSQTLFWFGWGVYKRSQGQEDRPVPDTYLMITNQVT
jgi:hypothetical protein